MLGKEAKEKIENRHSFLQNNFSKIEKIIKNPSYDVLKRKNIHYKRQFKKSLSESLLKEKNDKINIGHNLIKLNINKVDSILVSKKHFYKMKNIDLEKLKVYKNEKKEIIRQKNLFLEKANSLYNTNIIDLISRTKEQMYREGVTNIQNELRNKKMINKEEIKNFYENILNTIKSIENQIYSELDKRKEETDKRIKYDIKYINSLQEKALDKKLEKMNFLMNNLKELTKQMENINKDYQKIKNSIEKYITENIILKQKIKIQNQINKKRILEKRTNVKNINQIKKVLFDYRKYHQKIKEEKKIVNKNDNNQYYKKLNIKRKNSDILKKIKKLNYTNINNNSTNNQTNISTNNIDLLSKRNKNNLTNLESNTSYRNFASISNCMSTSSMSFINKRKCDVNKKEKILIKNLEKNLENLKNKLNLVKKKLNEEIPHNIFYDLIINIITKLKAEESDSVIFNIDNKLLTENMKIFPYQSRIFRQIFMNRLFYNKQLYQIYEHQMKTFDIAFNKNIFDANKKRKNK